MQVTGRAHVEAEHGAWRYDRVVANMDAISQQRAQHMRARAHHRAVQQVRAAHVCAPPDPTVAPNHGCLYLPAQKAYTEVPRHKSCAVLA